jgi:hypothetical protein
MELTTIPKSKSLLEEMSVAKSKLFIDCIKRQTNQPAA